MDFKNKKTTIALIVCAVSLALIGWRVWANIQAKKAEANRSGKEKVAVVTAAYPERKTIVPKFRFSGTLDPVWQADVAAKVDGRIEQVLVNEGDAVSAGEVLAILDRTDTDASLLNAKGLYADAKTDYEKAQADLARYTKLYAAGAISKESLDNKQFALENAKGKLDAAQGNWIAFVDSDDTAAPEYLEKMHKAVLETGADFAICSSQCIDETGKTLAGGEHRLLNEFLPQEEVLRRMVVSDFQVPWNKLYRRKLLENLRYPENKAFEDTCLMPVIYARAASACGVWDFLYNYRIVTGSAMHRKTTLKTLDWVEAWYRLFDVLYQNGIRDALCAAYRPILTAVWDIWLHLTPEERKSPRMKEAFAYERTARHRLMQARGVTLKNLWAAVICAASACSYLDLCRKRAERRQKTT